MGDAPRRRPRSPLRLLLLSLAALAVPVLLGYVAARVSTGEDDPAGGTTGLNGALRTLVLHGVGAPGCETDCEQYDVFTNFKTRVGTASQFAPIVAGPVSDGGPLLFNGYGATLVDAEGRLMADLGDADPGMRTVFARIRAGAVADFDRDGRNEILYGLNSYNIFESEQDVRQRQRRSLELLRTDSGDPRDYVPVSTTAFPVTACPLDRPGRCARFYDWVIDGDVVDVAVDDFNRDGWPDIAYLGTSLGDHSWIGFDRDLAEVGIPLSNENGARVGVVLNRGQEDPGTFSWPVGTSSVEAYLKDLYPVSAEVDYAPKSRRLLVEDLDRDGNVDLIVVGEKIVVGWGDGRGGFPVVEDLADVPGGSDAVVADFDRDGNLDVFVLADSETRYIGLARVACGEHGPDHPCALRGRNEGGVSVLHLGDGRRGLSPAAFGFPPIARPTSAAALDVDDDGWLDILATCESCVGPGVLRARADGGALAGYTLEPLSATEARTGMQRTLVTDVDRDGDLDAVFTGSGPAFRQVWTNDAVPGSDEALRRNVALLVVLLVVLAATGAVVLAVLRRRARPAAAGRVRGPNDDA